MVFSYKIQALKHNDLSSGEGFDELCGDEKVSLTPITTAAHPITTAGHTETPHHDRCTPYHDR